MSSSNVLMKVQEDHMSLGLCDVLLFLPVLITDTQPLLFCSHILNVKIANTMCSHVTCFLVAASVDVA